MKIIQDVIWTWLVPDRAEDKTKRKAWLRHGGKWIIFDRKERIEALAEKLAPYIDSGEIVSAKYWNGDPSALNVYSLDTEREKTGKIIDSLGARRTRVWEYDYAWDKNICSPLSFGYSWFSKFRTILQSYGASGALKLIREVLAQSRDKK